nr:hypothetical protein [Tanacetum cinerariifolium]
STWLLTGSAVHAQALSWQTAQSLVATAPAGSPANAFVSAQATDAAGNLYVAGGFNDVLQLGTTTLTSTSSARCFLAKYSRATNSFVWAQLLGGNSAQAIAVSGATIYVAGLYQTTVSFGTTTLAPFGFPTTSDAFVAKLTDAGTLSGFSWAQRAGGFADDYATAVAVSGSSVYIAGGAAAIASFGSLTLTSAGLQDAYVAKLTDAGNTSSYTWVQQFGGADDDGVGALALGSTGLYVAGEFESASAGGTDDEGATALSLSGNSLYVLGYSFSAAASFGTFTLNNPSASAGGVISFLSSLTDTTLPTRNAALQTELSLYPNPAQATTTVHLPAVLSALLYWKFGRAADNQKPAPASHSTTAPKTSRVIEAHGWAKGLKGKIVRAYAYVGDQGETVVATGPLSAVEPPTLVNTRSLAAQHDTAYLERPDLTTPTEELIMQIAAQWSVDPTTLDTRHDIAPGFGWQGHYDNPRKSDGFASAIIISYFSILALGEPIGPKLYCMRYANSFTLCSWLAGLFLTSCQPAASPATSATCQPVALPARALPLPAVSLVFRQAVLTLPPTQRYREKPAYWPDERLDTANVVRSVAALFNFEPLWLAYNGGQIGYVGDYHRLRLHFDFALRDCTDPTRYWYPAGTPAVALRGVFLTNWLADEHGQLRYDSIEESDYPTDFFNNNSFVGSWRAGLYSRPCHWGDHRVYDPAHRLDIGAGFFSPNVEDYPGRGWE